MKLARTLLLLVCFLGAASLPLHAAKAQPGTSGCSSTYSCTCNGAPYSAAQAGLGKPGLTIAEASQACNDGCLQARVSGNWDLLCGGSRVNQGAIAAPAAAATPARSFNVPNLSIPLPGLTFSQPFERDGDVFVPFLAEYIIAIYNLMIVVGSIATILTIMIAGLRWMVARGDPGAISQAKSMIGQALLAMMILLGVVLIINIVDPALTQFGSIRIPIVQPQELALRAMIEDNLKECSDIEGVVAQCSASTLKNPGGWEDILVDAINASARKYGTDPIQMAAHIEIETRHNVNWGEQIGPCGEIGPSQFMPTTYEAITGDAACCTAVSRKSGTVAEVSAACDDTYVNWPPDPAQIPHCRTDICGSCQVAAPSCIQKFKSPENLQFVTDTTAQLVKRLRSQTGDIGLALCAYNGRGERAANYARTAAGHYQRFCDVSK